MPTQLPFKTESPSQRGDVLSALTFINSADEPAIIYWIDYDGAAHAYKTLPVGETWQATTFETHAWVAIGAQSDTFLARAIAHDAMQTVTIKKRQRSTKNRADQNMAFSIQPLYVLPSDGIDHYLDVNGTIATSMMAWNNWFAEQTDGARLRIDSANGEPDVVFVRLSRSRDELNALTYYIAEELDERGFNAPNKIYAIYYDGRNEICGDGSMMKGVATIYLDGALCPGNLFTSDVARPGYWEFVMLHELLHALGCVPHCAPNNSVERPGHVDDHPQDIMYYKTATHPLILDAGRDDYYGHGRPDCFDLARSPYLDPLPELTVPPVRWQRDFIGRTLNAAPRLHGLRTRSAGDEMHFTVQNTTHRDLFLFFVDEKRRAHPYAHLAPYKTHHQHTYKRHAWVIAGLDTAGQVEIIEQFYATQRRAPIVIAGG